MLFGIDDQIHIACLCSPREHGIGIGKQAYMALEHGDVAIDVMRALKRAIDPDNILNPGKILPPQ